MSVRASGAINGPLERVARRVLMLREVALIERAAFNEACGDGAQLVLLPAR